MATIDQLKQALIQADAAGDTDAANLFANKIKEIQANPQPASDPVAQKQTSGIPAAAAAPMKFTEGATMGFADELSGGLAAAMSYPASMVNDRIAGETEGMGFGDRYEMYRNRERERLGQIAEERPGLSTASEIAGGVAGSLIPAQKGITAFKAGQTLPRMMGAGAIEGSAYGAVNALGRTDELDGQAVQDVGMGTATGALGGAVAPAVTQPLSGIANAITQRFKPAYEQAANRVAGALGQARMGGDDVAAKMGSLGDDAMLVDAMGTPGRSLGRAAINASPEAEDVLLSGTTARASNMPDRLSSKLLEASGLDQPRTIEEMQSSIASASRPAITRAYEGAKEAGQDIPLAPFRDLMKLPMFQTAIKNAQASQKNYLPGQGQGGRLGFLNEVKKQIDSVANTAERSGDFNTSNQARAIAKELRTRVDANTPEYGGARELAKQNFALQEAVELGAQGAKPTVANDFARNVAALDDSSRQMAGQGYAGAKIGQIENRRATPGAIDAMFGSNRAKEAMGAALGPRASIVDDQLAKEQAYNATQRALSTGSTTAKQLAQMGSLGGLGAAGGYISTGDPAQSAALAGGLMATRAGGGRLMQAMNANNEAKVAPIVAEILAGRELPREVLEQIQRSPGIQAAISRAVAMAPAQQ